MIRLRLLAHHRVYSRKGVRGEIEENSFVANCREKAVSLRLSSASCFRVMVGFNNDIPTRLGW
jgi:hypothetical protein